MKHLFTYGHLMESAVISDVLGRQVKGALDVRIPKYKLMERGLLYLFPDPKSIGVVGVVYYDLTDEDFQKLDSYQCVDKGLYRRETTNFIHGRDKLCTVEIYTPGPQIHKGKCREVPSR